MTKIALYSGGKDSMFAIIDFLKNNKIDYIININNKNETQLHAGPEINKEIMSQQLNQINIPHINITINNKLYLRKLFLELKKIIKKYNVTDIITGDSWHPYTSGIGDMLAAALNVKIIRPVQNYCVNRNTSYSYMKELIKRKIESIIISIRGDIIPKSYLGKTINENIIEDFIKMGIDPAGESGEYQTFVTKSPIMKGKIKIKEYNIEKVIGKNEKEWFYRLNIKKINIV